MGVKQVSEWKELVGRIRSDVRALYLAYKDSRTPWYAKMFAALVVGYAFSPLDLIPDFIPVLGHLDDLILIPLGVWLAVRMIPPDVLADAREMARAETSGEDGLGWVAAGLILTLWLLALAAACGVLGWFRESRMEYGK